MKEFMLLIKNEGDSKAALSPQQQQQFLLACKVYIEELTQSGNLISAQPLIREGVIITGDTNKFTETAFDNNKEIQVGYYHIMAADMDDAVAIAKRNPEFAFVEGAKVEVRPIKMREQATQFTYPNSK